MLRLHIADRDVELLDRSFRRTIQADCNGDRSNEEAATFVDRSDGDERQCRLLSLAMPPRDAMRHLRASSRCSLWRESIHDPALGVFGHRSDHPRSDDPRTHALDDIEIPPLPVETVGPSAPGFEPAERSPTRGPPS